MKQKESIFKGTGIPFLLLALIWGVHFINLKFPLFNLTFFGILPRDIEGLRGILFSPFLHSSTDNFAHIFNNSIPLFVLSWLFILSYKKLFARVTIFIWLFSGLCTWLAGRGGYQVYHIGASSVIYGLAFFLFFSDPKICHAANAVAHIYLMRCHTLRPFCFPFYCLRITNIKSSSSKCCF